MNDIAQEEKDNPAAATSSRIALTVAAAFFMETLDATIIVPAAGWCAARFGARTVFATAIGIFTVASLVCGLAPSFAVFVAARVCACCCSSPAWCVR